LDEEKMRAEEFIIEQQVSLAAQKSIPDMTSVGVPGLPMGPTNYYHKYRLGVMMAVSPEFENDYPQDGKFVDDMVMVAYSKADADIINRANAKMGYKQKRVTSKGSRELEDTHTVSPVANWMKKK
jgi:hypothetical protein